MKIAQGNYTRPSCSHNAAALGALWIDMHRLKERLDDEELDAASHLLGIAMHSLLSELTEQVSGGKDI